MKRPGTLAPVAPGPAAETRLESEWAGGVRYPSSDGKPMADNGNQEHWIMLVAGELRALFPEHYVAADRLWYPVEGRPELAKAPDVMIVLGRPADRPPHARSSYRQWLDGGAAPTAVFEFVSPGNPSRELCEEKLAFYDRYGVEEYYVYDPQSARDSRTPFLLRAWQRRGPDEGGGPAGLEEVRLPPAGGWRSPRLGITFARAGGVPGGELRLLRPDGQPFQTVAELRGEADRERARADRERRENEALKAKLRAVGIDPDAP